MPEKGLNTQFIIPAVDGEIIIDTTIINDNAQLTTAQFDICQRLDELCSPIAAPRLTFNPSEIASVSINRDDGKDIYLQLRPPRPTL